MDDTYGRIKVTFWMKKIKTLESKWSKFTIWTILNVRYFKKTARILADIASL